MTDVDGLVRLTVSHDARRADLVVPGAVPLAELLPEFSGSVGLPREGPGGDLHVCTTAGQVLTRDLGLLDQGVVDGAWLTLLRTGHAPQPRYDDPVEAAAAIAGGLPPVPEEAASAGAAAALLLGAIALLGLPPGPLAAGSAAAVAALLASGSLLVGSPTRAVAASVLAGVYAAGAGQLLLVRPDLADRCLAAGVGLLLAGTVALFGPGRRALAGIPVVTTGLALAVVGVVGHVGLAALLLVAAVGSSAGLLPSLALVPAGRRRASGPVDVLRLRADVLGGHALLAAVYATVGVLLVLATPMAVARGGAPVCLAAGVTVLLAARRVGGGPAACAATAAGGGTLAALALTVLLDPVARPVVAGTATVAGLLLAGAPYHSLHLRRLLDLLETAAAVAPWPLVAWLELVR